MIEFCPLFESGPVNSPLVFDSCEHKLNGQPKQFSANYVSYKNKLCVSPCEMKRNDS